MIEKKVNTSFFIADFEELSKQEKNLIVKAKHALKSVLFILFRIFSWCINHV